MYFMIQTLDASMLGISRPVEELLPLAAAVMERVR